MNITISNLNETIKPIFNNFGLPSMNFKYWPDYNEIISEESFEQDDDLLYKIIIRLDKNNNGTIISGGIAGNEICNEKVLGHVSYNNDKWSLITI